ncbi:hypothetical protein GJ744_009574 [Endocarpon pusillum]|uniref:Uncharacterized protein n=1 Tax=Endocarpon pusillum TaxID=364733 RepID=A0A8H7AFS5_9EURO|nr:hypothetical protein GJ744_009574 [Endocarpon pusillum]
MSSPSSSREVWRENLSPIAVPVASKQISTIPTNKLPLPPPRRTPGSKTVTQEKRSYSPSLVQFSRQQKRSRLVLDLFSIIRSTLIAATLAGIPLGVVQARSTGSAFLYLNILKLLFVCFFLSSSPPFASLLTFLKTARVLSCALRP